MATRPTTQSEQEASHRLGEHPDYNVNNVKLPGGWLMMEVFKIPKRSPDLNVLDYAVWAKVETLLRAQERKMPKSRYESRAQFEALLDRTACSLPPEFIRKSILNLKERCQRL